MSTTINIAIGSEYEDDGQYIITIRMSDPSINYIAISKNLQGSYPEKVYPEWNNQKNGEFIEKFSFSLNETILKIDFNDAPIPEDISQIELSFPILIMTQLETFFTTS